MRLLDSDVTTKDVLGWQGLHLIHFQGSACSQKTRIFLSLKGIDWQSHHLDLSRQQNYEPWFLGVNPRGLVPVLIHDGAVHIESNDILIYLEEKFPQPPLLPAEQHSDILDALRAEDDLHLNLRALTMRFVIPKFLAQKKPYALSAYEQSNGSVQGNADSLKNIELAFWQDFAKHGVTDQQVKESAQAFKQTYSLLEQQLEQYPYLTGGDFSVLDIAWFIYTERLTAAGYPFQRLHPKVFAWYQSLAARPEFRKEVKAPAFLRLATAVMQTVQRIKGATFEQVARL
jgi:glutathione S-transferase